MNGRLHGGMNKKAVVLSDQSSDHQQTPVVGVQIDNLGGEAT